MSTPPLVVLHSVPGAWLPATQTWLHTQLRFLPGAVEAHVLCDRVENEDRFPVPDVHPLTAVPRWPRLADGALRRLHLRRHRGHLPAVVHRGGAALLHSHFGPEGWRNARAARRLGLPHVVSFYGYDVGALPRTHPRWRRRYRELFALADLILCEGEHMAASLTALGCPADTVHVHRLGVDLEAIPFRPRRWDGHETLRVLLASAFRRKKGLPIAIEALGRLTRDVDLRLTIIGDATDAPEAKAEKGRILAALARHDLEERTDRLGFQPHAVLHEEARRHHVYIAPSLTAPNGDTEGGAPVSLIEMAASGMPLLSTFHADIPGVVRHGETGYLARESDIDDLDAQLRRLLDEREAWPAMLERGRRHVESRFDAAAQGPALARRYDRLAPARRAVRRACA